MEEIMAKNNRPLINDAKMLVLLPKEDHEFVKEMAKVKQTTANEVVRQLIAQRRNLSILNNGRI